MCVRAQVCDVYACACGMLKKRYREEMGKKGTLEIHICISIRTKVDELGRILPHIWDGFERGSFTFIFSYIEKLEAATEGLSPEARKYH